MRFRVPARRTGSTVGFSLALVVFAFGCAHSDSAADRHMAEMQTAIGEVQSDQDRANRRLEVLAAGPTEEKRTAPAVAPSQTPTGVTHTVQIGTGDDAHESDDPNDPKERPEIRLQGAGGAPRSARGKTSRGRSERADPSASEDGARSDSAPSSVLDPEAKKAYEGAVALVHAKNYERALEALSAFLVRWPDHPYVENALYWRGESFYARGEHLRAAESFEAVLARFGGGQKAPDALLKIGMCHERLGSSERAKEYFERLRREYPRSDAARKIPAVVGNDTRGPVGPKESR